MGMLGAVQAPLAQAYGPGGAGISAPEANRGRITSGLIADNHVQVQDQCRPLSGPEICHELRDAYEKNADERHPANCRDQKPSLRKPPSTASTWPVM